MHGSGLILRTYSDLVQKNNCVSEIFSEVHLNPYLKG